MASSSSSSSSSSVLSLSVGHLSLQGLRPTMEDEIFIIQNYQITQQQPLSETESESAASSSATHFTPTPAPAPAPALARSSFSLVSFFGVFDGHGGTRAAKFTRDHLWANLLRELARGRSAEESLHAAYLATDNEFCSEITQIADQRDRESKSDSNQSRSRFSDGFASSDRQSRDSSGTTAVSALVDHDSNTVWIANAGDSRGLIVHRGGLVTALTRDHKADRPDEVERIRKAGGFVVQRRVMGELAISRAIGDLDFKEKGFSFVLADPEIESRRLSDDECFIVLACDGLFDVMTNEQVGRFVWSQAASQLDDEQIAEKIVRHAIENLYTRDNVTTIVIRLRPIDFTLMINRTGAEQHSEAESSPSSSVESAAASAVPRSKKLELRKYSTEEPLELTVHHEPEPEVELEMTLDEIADGKLAEVKRLEIEAEEALEAVEVNMGNSS